MNHTHLFSGKTVAGSDDPFTQGAEGAAQKPISHTDKPECGVIDHGYRNVSPIQISFERRHENKHCELCGRGTRIVITMLLVATQFAYSKRVCRRCMKEHMPREYGFFCEWIEEEW